MIAKTTPIRHPLFPEFPLKKLSFWEQLFAPGAITEQCHAKLNLFLHVTGKRPDGYHHLESWVVFAAPADIITLRPAASSRLIARGPFAPMLPPPAENLVIKTIRLMAQRHNKPDARFHITLTKHLPIGAGLGGGSANVAGVLRALQKLWGFAWQADDAAWLAQNLGADVPVCLFGKPSMLRGIGEQLEPTHALPETHVVLVFPGAPIATPNIFGMIAPPYTPPAMVQTHCDSLAELVTTLQDTRNDLMQAAISQQPDILKAYRMIAQQPGCLLPRMSGSGSTCFGIFADANAARAAAQTIAAAAPAWWVQSARLL